MVGRPQRSHTGRAEVAQEVLQRSRNVAQRSRRGPVEVAQRSRKGRAKEAVWDKIQRGGPNLTQSGGRPVQRSPLPGSAGVEVPQRSRRHPPEVPQRSQRGPPEVPQCPQKSPESSAHFGTGLPWDGIKHPCVVLNCVPQRSGCPGAEIQQLFAL